MNISTNSTSSFHGKTKIFAIADTHQETRKTSAFLSKILNSSKDKKNILFLHDGDLFKGIYPRELERDAYIKMKELNPDIEMVMTLGNNDFGFNKEGLEYLINTVKTFTSKGIRVVCANIFDFAGKRPEWLKPYTIVKRAGDRTLVTGFCIDNINTAKFGLFPKKQESVLEEIIQAVKKEQPDNVVVLNHDYMPSSQNIHKKFSENGIDIDITIGGHNHEVVPADLEKHIYCPEAFAESMYEINLVNNGGKKTIENLNIQRNKSLPVNNEFLADIEKFEKEAHLLEDIVPSTLHLPKKYSEPSPLGSFLADEMKKQSNSDVAFFSTGFLMQPLEYEPNAFITNYKLKKAVIADTPVKKVALSGQELFEVFAHAMKGNGYGVSNPKFLQCSNNIMLAGSSNPEKGVWELKQVYIDEKPLNLDKKYTCAIDSFIAEGGQGFTILQEAVKNEVILNGKELRINEALLNGLVEASKKYKKGETYPNFKILAN